MELFKGTKGEYIIIDGGSGRIALHTRRRNWLAETLETTTVVFPLSSVEDIYYEPPVSFFNGKIRFTFDSDDNIHRTYEMSIPWYDKKQGYNLVRVIEQITKDFT